MKANRKFVEGREAVSAVIGVILMVAITVAIAAAVYMYLGGMLTNTPKPTPAVILSKAPSDKNCTITVSPSQSNLKWSDVRFTLVNLTTGESISADVPSDHLYNESDNPNIWSGVEIHFPNDNNITGGQIIYIKNLAKNNNYKFTLTYKPTGGVMGTTDWTQ